uniref:Retrotransposable element Tf2 n=1 Tax=Cajanus cajan TaxID=3821 RepID=A0A151U591_CAJCA|nr:Retrotransposable element Tf2 [Cajanus cajan]
MTELAQILEILEKKDREHAREINDLRDDFEEFKASVQSGGLNSKGFQNPLQVRNVKLDFPRFDGSDVLQWIFRAEQFFEYYNTPDEQRIVIAAVHFEKNVVPWYQMMQRTSPIISWNTLTRSLELEFGPSPFDSPRSTLFKLTQTGSVNDYYVEFTNLANRIYGVSAEALLDCFISGLKPDIKREIIAQAPNSLLKAISLARLFEEKYSVRSKQPFVARNQSQQVVNQSYTNPTQQPILSTPNVKPTAMPFRNSNVRRMSPAEMQSRRERGLCFTCDEKFSATHRCPNKQYLLLQVEEEEEKEVEINENIAELEEELEHHLSFNALKGAAAMGTMRFTGSIAGKEVHILLDSGNSDNFLQPKLAHYLKLPIEPASGLQVMVGNGNSLSTEGKISNLQVQVQGQLLQLPVYLLSVSGADLVLGAAWLATLGPHIADYSSLTIKFYKDKKLVTLRGEKIKSAGLSQFNHLKRLTHTQGIAEIFTLQLMSTFSEEDQWKDIPDTLEPEIAILLYHYRKIFAKPMGLPPPRSQNHRIPLLQGSAAVKVRPYKYPHSQKQQIEVMIKEMLEDGIISPSSSPFSSPIILVKKKDGTWRFCTDYRALNAITVKDSFPIPTVEELLDELFGANYFSKLDLRAGYHQILVHEEDRGFLGLTGYYRRFIKGYAAIANPLTNLLKKDNFKWTNEAAAAFIALKQAITSAPVLTLPDFSQPFVLETDASGSGIGAYKPGVENLAADALSRSFFMASSLTASDLVQKIKAALVLDTSLQVIIADCTQGKVMNSPYTVLDGLLLWKDRIVVPNDSTIINQILQEYHSSPIGGHSGVARTIARVTTQFFWKGMNKDIAKYVQQCLICQKAKTATISPAGLLQPLPIPNQIWEDISMDFIVGLPPVEGYTVVFVTVDRLSKYAHFAPLKANFSSKKVAEVFLNTVVKLHGFPNSIVSDRDKVFTSSFWQHLLHLSGTTLKLSTAYHPQTDGQSEALNKCLEMYLRCFTHERPRDWIKFLPWAEFWYNTSFHHSAQMSPFKVVYGREPPTLLKYNHSNADPPSIQMMLQQRDRVIAELKVNLLKAQQKMKKYADQKRMHKEFQVGDLVLVKLQPYRQHSLALRKNQKLGLRYFGPFPIQERIGSVAYKLLLPDYAKLHPVFHISQLKQFRGVTDVVYVPLPLTTSVEGPVVLPFKILSIRDIIRAGQTVHQILVQWEGFSEDEATWEDSEEMAKSYPNLNLEDKVIHKGGSIVTEREITSGLGRKEVDIMDDQG